MTYGGFTHFKIMIRDSRQVYSFIMSTVENCEQTNLEMPIAELVIITDVWYAPQLICVGVDNMKIDRYNYNVFQPPATIIYLYVFTWYVLQC